MNKDAIKGLVVIIALALVFIYACNGLIILIGIQMGADSIECNWIFCQITFTSMTIDKTCTENGVVTPCP